MKLINFLFLIYIFLLERIKKRLALEYLYSFFKVENGLSYLLVFKFVVFILNEISAVYQKNSLAHHHNNLFTAKTKNSA